MRLSRAAIKWCRRRSLGIDGGGSYASFSTMRVRMPEEFSPISRREHESVAASERAR